MFLDDTVKAVRPLATKEIVESRVPQWFLIPISLLRKGANRSSRAIQGNYMKIQSENDNATRHGTEAEDKSVWWRNEGITIAYEG